MPIDQVKRIARDLCPPLLWQAARRLYRRAVTTPPSPSPTPPPAVRLISTIEELEEVFVRVRAAQQVSHDAFLQTLDGICFATPDGLPADPESPEYHQAQLAFYRLLSGRSAYAADCEVVHDFDRAETRAHPFPYYTRSCLTVGEQLIAVGFLIRALDLAPCRRVLEIGPGFGLLTTELARTDFRVTAVDVNPHYLELLRERCEREGLPVTLVCSGMLDYEPAERFERVVFYESFHHCGDPEAMVRRLDALVAEGGMVAFGGEPITDDFPMPWGMRPDGRAVWAIRTAGWLELGFRTDYFLDLLGRHGWSVRILASADVPWLRVFVARRASETT